LNSFVMNLISFPMYGEVAHFVFSLLMSCTFCVLQFVSFYEIMLFCHFIRFLCYLFNYIAFIVYQYV
jgi:hypothetical protein